MSEALNATAYTATDPEKAFAGQPADIEIVYLVKDQGMYVLRCNRTECGLIFPTTDECGAVVLDTQQKRLNSRLKNVVCYQSPKGQKALREIYPGSHRG